MSSGKNYFADLEDQFKPEEKVAVKPKVTPKITPKSPPKNGPKGVPKSMSKGGPKGVPKSMPKGVLKDKKQFVVDQQDFPNLMEALNTVPKNGGGQFDEVDFLNKLDKKNTYYNSAGSNRTHYTCGRCRQSSRHCMCDERDDYYD